MITNYHGAFGDPAQAVDFLLDQEADFTLKSSSEFIERTFAFVRSLSNLAAPEQEHHLLYPLVSVSGAEKNTFADGTPMELEFTPQCPPGLKSMFASMRYGKAAQTSCLMMQFLAKYGATLEQLPSVVENENDHNESKSFEQSSIVVLSTWQLKAAHEMVKKSASSQKKKKHNNNASGGASTTIPKKEVQLKQRPAWSDVAASVALQESFSQFWQTRRADPTTVSPAKIFHQGYFFENLEKEKSTALFDMSTMRAALEEAESSPSSPPSSPSSKENDPNVQNTPIPKHKVKAGEKSAEKQKKGKDNNSNNNITSTSTSLVGGDAVVANADALASVSAYASPPTTPPPSKSDSAATTTTATTTNSNNTFVLPIDEYKEKILETIGRQQVTIIKGETGCGKSTRIPVMLLRSGFRNNIAPKQKIFVCVPRRIAAKSLVDRLRSCEPELSSHFALRLGHGVREFESHNTRVIFATTGYMVRLLANNPQSLKTCSHLVIDEVHERSVDTDLLCLIAKRHLQIYPHLKLVLMSATLTAGIYQDYFSLDPVTEPPIQVGAKRFPIKEFYLEDLLAPSLGLKGGAHAMNVTKLQKHCSDCTRKKEALPAHAGQLQYKIACKLALSVADSQSAVLIFVAGMLDITSIVEILEASTVAGKQLITVPIHSDIPFEDQMKAYDKIQPHQLKIVVATNAAESALTLPDVDHVICLGACKRLTYDQASHRQMLEKAWITRANAIQRKGRTGRVREGTVYKLYTRDIYQNVMEASERGEITEIPLDSVILTMKDIFHEEPVSSMLSEMIEPPETANISASFKFLYQKQYIQTPDDVGGITEMGRFVTAMGIELALGDFIGRGIQLGVAAEAIELAAILSYPKTPWLIPNPMVQSNTVYNGTYSICSMEGAGYVCACETTFVCLFVNITSSSSGLT
jgi:superfamily II DNA/RNA helicase